MAALTPDKPIEIFHIEGRRSVRVVWLCEELDFPYVLTFKQGDIFGSMLTIRQNYPIMPIVPVVRIGDDFIVESGAILEILLDRYGNGQLKPSVESRDYLLHTQWMHFAEGTAATRISMWRFIATAIGQDMDAMPPGYRAETMPLSSQHEEVWT